MTNRTKLAAAGVMLTVLSGVTFAQQEIKLTISAGHSPVILWVKHLNESFISATNRELGKSNKFRIVWTEAYAGTLAKIGSELETIEQGISDLGIVNTVFHPAKMPLQNVSYVAPFGPSDPKIVMKVFNGLHEKLPAMRAAWEKHNQVYLISVPVDDYGIFGTEPVNRLESMAGKRYGGPPALLAWIKGTGAVGVSATLSSYYNDIKSGIYNGAITLATGAVPIKLYEVAPYYSQLRFGAMCGTSLTVNKNRWDGLPAEVRAALRTGAVEFATAYETELASRTVAAHEAIRANKGTLVAVSDAERSRIAKAIENPSKAWIESAARAGYVANDVLKAYMDGIRSEGGAFARDWDRE